MPPSTPLRLLAALVVAIGCSSSTPPSVSNSRHSVLFIGNSLTYTNDLPGTVATIAASAGDTIDAASVAYGNFALIDHLNGGQSLPTIAKGGWEFVVLQQGPSTVPVNADSLKLWTQMFAPHIRAVGATPALLMVWPDSTREAFFDDCRASYLAAAQSVGGMFIPAGYAWQIA